MWWLRFANWRLVPAAMALMALACSLGVAAAQPARAGSSTHLIMVDAPDCIYCRKFLAEIGPLYPTSAEGRQAPMIRVTKGDAGLRAFAPAAYTPTFILVQDGREVDRLVGYPGKLYFWSELDTMLDKLGSSPGVPNPAAPDRAPGLPALRDANAACPPKLANEVGRC